jgi:hypothetical protein
MTASKEFVIIAVFQSADDGVRCEAMAPALQRERGLPSGTIGPVFLAAMRRFASIDL